LSVIVDDYFSNFAKLVFFSFSSDLLLMKLKIDPQWFIGLNGTLFTPGRLPPWTPHTISYASGLDKAKEKQSKFDPTFSTVAYGIGYPRG
jgi:hypothetical protein